MTIPRSKIASSAEPNQVATAPKLSRSRVVRKPLAAASVTSTPASKATKRNQPAALLLRDEGATLDQMIAATGWLPHTMRAALTGLKKLGYAISSDKIDGVRTYRAVEPK